MQNPRFAMLAFVLANINIVTQEIIAKAEELDPDSIRLWDS